jgi:hypothetical protein
VRLGSSLNAVLEDKGLGHWEGFIRVPECSTLIYYGADAQAMYKAIEDALYGDSRFRGALVTIRQGREQRELVVPGRILN